MSRIGKKPVVIPQGVTATVEKNLVTIKGAKGTLTFEHNFDVSVKVAENNVIVEKIGKGKDAPATWGTTVRIIENMIEGVVNGFKKQIRKITNRYRSGQLY